MKKVLPLVLLGAAILLVCIGIGAIAANFYFSRSESVDLGVWKTPLSQIDAKRLNPADALEVLAGIAETNALDDALAQGDWEAAFAQSAYSPELPDPSRAGTLLLLGSRYARAKQPTKAAWCYQYAATLAIISPAPSDLTRVQILLEAASGLRDLGVQVSARAALDQAYLIAQYSPTLPRAARAQLLGQLAQTYQALGVSNLATQAQQKSAEAASLPAEDAILTTQRAFRVQPSDLPDNSELKARVKARVTAAKELIDQLNLKPPKSALELPSDLIRTLGDRLYEEDGARIIYYDTQSKAATDPPAQVAVLRDRIRWLALKLRVARGGFGVSLVAEWETDAKNIAHALHQAYDQLFQIYERAAAIAPDAATGDRQVEAVLRAELVAGRWGLDPEYDEEGLRTQLSETTQRLRDAQVPALRLDALQRANQWSYLLVPDELYGQGEKALPK